MRLGDLLPSSTVPALQRYGGVADVVVRVRGGASQAHDRIEAVLATKPANRFFGDLIVAVEHAAGADFRAWLENAAGVHLVEAQEGAVSAAVRAAGTRDVVLLDGDVKVHGTWLDRLAAHARSDAQIGMVAAFSNDASLCAFPDPLQSTSLPPGTSLAQIDEACAAANAGKAVDLPIVADNCTYIRRACLDQVGLFARDFEDGEASDFAERAIAFRWRIVLAGDVFVQRAGERVSLAKQARTRRPVLATALAEWIDRNPAMPMRIAAQAALIRRRNVPVVLHVLHTLGGGTEKHVAELAAQRRDDATQLVMLAGMAGGAVAITLLLPQGQAWRKLSFRVDALKDSVAFLKSFGVTQVHVHHAVDVLDGLRAFLAAVDVPYDLSVHDYALICPRINLIDAEANYCGEPDIVDCLACLAKEPKPRASDIIWWRERGLRLIADADRVFCPSEDAAERIQRYARDASVIVVPHERDLYRPSNRPGPPKLQKGDKLRIATLGVFSEHKGAKFLLQCVEQSLAARVPIGWRLIGDFSRSMKESAERLSGALSVTGSYRQEDVVGLINDYDPHIVFFSQHWPETYSFTLSEAFAAGRPVLVPQIGAFPERVEGVPWCWTYPVDWDAAAVVAFLEDIRAAHFLTGKEPGTPARNRVGPKSIDEPIYSTRYLRGG
jgi:glycosyltransferase involved in cell wall biosynthesis